MNTKKDEINSEEEFHNNNISINKSKRKKKINLNKLKANVYIRRFRFIKNLILLVLLLIIICIIIIFLILNYTQKKRVFKLKLKNNELKCKQRYYIPFDNSSNKQCLKCSIEHCQKCYGNSISNTCISCLGSYSPKYDNNNKITLCEFPDKKEEEKLIAIIQLLIIYK